MGDPESLVSGPDLPVSNSSVLLVVHVIPCLSCGHDKKAERVTTNDLTPNRGPCVSNVRNKTTDT